MSKHTPGPWHVGMRSGNNGNTVYAYNGESEHFDQSICTVYGIYLYKSAKETKDNPGAANARLIAAAPEMYEALQRCHEWLQGTEPHRAQYIGEILSKIEGH